MEQFSLEKYLANPSRRVVTRDGCPVRILCTDRISCHKDIIGLVMINGSECIFTWAQQGKISPNSDTPNDLFFAPEKHEGWVNIYRSEYEDYYKGMVIFSSKEDAIEKGRRFSDYITTTKIEWEE